MWLQLDKVAVEQDFSENIYLFLANRHAVLLHSHSSTPDGCDRPNQTAHYHIFYFLTDVSVSPSTWLATQQGRQMLLHFPTFPTSPAYSLIIISSSVKTASRVGDFG
jgi:hypothetical protein